MGCSASSDSIRNGAAALSRHPGSSNNEAFFESRSDWKDGDTQQASSSRQSNNGFYGHSNDGNSHLGVNDEANGVSSTSPGGQSRGGQGVPSLRSNLSSHSSDRASGNVQRPRSLGGRTQVGSLSVDRVFHQGWLRKQPLKPQNSRHAFSRWQTRYFCLVQMEGIVWLAYYTDMSATKNKGAIPLWKNSYVASAGNPLILVICNNGPENVELIVQAESVAEKRQWSNVLNDAISTHACDPVSTADAAAKVSGPTIHIFNGDDDDDDDDRAGPGDDTRTSSAPREGTPRLHQPPSPQPQQRQNDQSQLHHHHHDSHVAEEQALIDAFQQANILENQTRSPQSSMAAARQAQVNPSPPPVHENGASTRSVARGGGVLRSAMVRSWSSRSQIRGNNNGGGSVASLASRGSVRSVRRLQRFGLGFDRVQELQKTLTTAQLPANWVDNVSDISVTDCIASGGDSESVNGSNGAGDVADPLVALRVTLSTNVFWFVKLSVAVFRTLSTKLGIPLSVGNTDDGGVDVQEYVHELNGFAKALQSSPQHLALPHVQIALQPAMWGDNATPIAAGGIMGWLYKKGRLNKAWKKRYVALYAGSLFYFAGQLVEEKGAVRLDDIVDVHEFLAKNPPSADDAINGPNGNGGRASSSSGGGGGGAAFLVRTRSGREYRFFADSRNTCRTWVKTIETAMMAHRKKAPPPRPAD